MKRRIKEAYDTIQLSKASKERIWEDIMDSKRKGFRAVLKRGKNQKWSAIPAALALVAVIAVVGSLGIRGSGDHDTPMVAAEPTGNTATAPVEPTDKIASTDILFYEQEYADVPAYVRECVILYAQALDGNWPKEDWQRIGLDLELYQVKDHADPGFALKDLNGDGLQDLLVYGGSQLYQIIVSEYWEKNDILGSPAYTEWILTHDQYLDQACMTLCQNNVIMLTYVLNDSDYYFSYNRIVENEYGRPVLEMIETVYAVDGTEWFAGPDQETAAPITKDEAEDIKARYTLEEVEPRLFSKTKAEIVNFQHQFDGVDARYLPLLMNYGKAICEDWSQSRWIDAGLSTEIYFAQDEYMSLEYALVDMDGNGTEELLIFGEDQLYALYVLRDDQPDESLKWTIHNNAVRLSIQLCEDNIVKVVQKDASGGTDISFYQVGRDGVGVISLVMVNDVLQTQDGQWYAGPNAKDAVAVTEQEAQAIISAYKEEEIDTKPMFNIVRIG